ncbi:MAG: hypothetical protein NC310_03905 [Roseburia sp.]|nr:hypothetical protein [Anaeroplasma bactoclasticum]MCM1196204.1 hypothetical protein [Roseburia sp.]MCM1556029.1 hypothetical protein [Anaeroplasma bactoclasticum]
MKIYKKLILSGLCLLILFSLFSCKDNDNNDDKVDLPPASDVVELKFKTAVLSSKEETSDLTIKASINGDKGTIYAVLSDTDSTPTESEIVAGGATWKWFGNSGDALTLEQTITNLDQGKEYFAYFVIKDGDTYSSIVKKQATTIEFVDKGDGTMENPFKVSTIEDLEHVGMGPYDKYNLDWKAEATYYKLVNDIDLTEKYGEGKQSWIPISIGKNGVFDGGGYQISGVYINTQSTTNLGLFSGINIGGVVKNLKLQNVSITSNGYVEAPKQYNASLDGDAKYVNSAVEGAQASGIYVGALTGDCKGIIEKVAVTDAHLKVSGSRVGGLTGRIYGDEGTEVKVTNVYVEATIEGVSRLGGIVGLIDAKSKATFTTPEITNAIFKGTIKGETFFPTEDQYIAGEYLGGFAGYARAFHATNIAVSANIEGMRHVGGVVGFLQYNKNVSNYSILKESLFKGELKVNVGSNVGPIVGNRSNSNATIENCIAEGFYLSSKFMKGESELEFDKLPATAKYGVLVEELSLDWFKENLPNFNLEDFFKLDESHFPTLK